MRRRDNSYSRFVAWAKIVLPLAALALLSTVFLLARNIDPTQAIPFAEINVEELAREQRVSTPNYAGVTEDGAAISVTASTARPDPDSPDRVDATDLEAELITATGARYQLSSQRGEIDSGADMAYLEGDVVVTTSSGYRITSDAMSTSLSRTLLESTGPVQADGPAGRLDAGAMSLEPLSDAAGNDSDNHLLVFNKGVKLVYTPSD
ncbi:MAG: LPS export ABC transporter periplasmic protein LptC [Celeribacter sp.]|jgi:lipopolysaccharide export system protein LptC